MKKATAYILVLALVLLCACAPGQEGEDTVPQGEVQTDKNSISIGVYNFDTYNPIATLSDSVTHTSALIYDSLIRQTEDFGVQPLLCTDYTVTDGGLTYTFNLREGIKWHDGSDFGASDVEYTFDAINSLEQSAYKDRFENIESYARSGQYKFIITIREANAGFINLMDIPIVKKGTDCINGLVQYIPIGTGMYRYTDSGLSRAVRLVRNEDYIASDKPQIGEIIIKQLPDRDALSSALEAGEIDVASFSAEEMRNYNPKGNLSEVSYSNNTLTFIGINANIDGLDSSRVRRALSYALSRDEISKNVFFGRAESVWVPTAPASHLHKEIYTLVKDKQRASELLIEAKYSPGGDGILQNSETGVSLSFDLLVNENNPLRVAAAEKIKTDLAQIGVDIKVRKLTFENYRARVSAGDYDMFIGEVKIGDDLDLSMFAGANASYCVGSSDRFDTINNRCTYSTDAASYAQAYGELSEIFLNEMPIISLAMATDVLVFNNRIKSVTPPYYGSVFANVASWEANN